MAKKRVYSVAKNYYEKLSLPREKCEIYTFQTGSFDNINY